MNDSLEFNVDLQTFNGPLEVLLDLAKSQKVDLEKISITILVDQFLEFIKSNEKINLDLASEYLLMATWLTYLKSKLLLPDTDEEIAFCLTYPVDFANADQEKYIASVSNIADLSNMFIDEMSINESLVLAQMKTVSTDRASEIADIVNSKIDSMVKGQDLVFETTGLLVFLKDFVSMVVKSSITSIVISVFAILLIIFIFFKRLLWAFLSVIPLLSAVILNFGLMGLIGVELSHLTALLTSVIIGVGADFSIHYISDYFNNIKSGMDRDVVNLHTSQDVGYPIMLDVASNMGFAALLFSSIIPINYIGGLMVFAMISTSFGALTILSSSIELLKNRA